jgi:hypothetical protein
VPVPDSALGGDTKKRSRAPKVIAQRMVESL